MEKERIITQATLISKQNLPYEDIGAGKGAPVIKPIYEIVFQLENKENIVFSVSSFEFDVLTIQDAGELVYIKHKHYNELIRFADKIKDFKL